MPKKKRGGGRGGRRAGIKGFSVSPGSPRRGKRKARGFQRESLRLIKSPVVTPALDSEETAFDVSGTRFPATGTPTGCGNKPLPPAPAFPPPGKRFAEQQDSRGRRGGRERRGGGHVSVSPSHPSPASSALVSTRESALRTLFPGFERGEGGEGN